MTLGFDPAKGRFVGSWAGSMMTHFWVYEGSLDASGQVLTLDCEGPDYETPGRMAPYQDIIELKGDDRRILRARTHGADGAWKDLMTVEYRRRQ
jgi:hypothetical protein